MRWTIFLLSFSAIFGAQIQVADQILEVEIADNTKTRADGLMGRTELLDGHGMLFIYPKEQRLVFWMKNTLIPLSIAFFNADKVCVNILDMDPPLGKPYVTYRSTAPALYALEVPQGWFEKHRITRGAKFSFLDQTNEIK